MPDDENLYESPQTEGSHRPGGTGSRVIVRIVLGVLLALLAAIAVVGWFVARSVPQ